MEFACCSLATLSACASHFTRINGCNNKNKHINVGEKMLSNRNLYSTRACQATTTTAMKMSEKIKKIICAMQSWNEHFKWRKENKTLSSRRVVAPITREMVFDFHERRVRALTTPNTYTRARDNANEMSVCSGVRHRRVCHFLFKHANVMQI